MVYNEYRVWLDGDMHRDEAFLVSAKGYKSALRLAIKTNRAKIKQLVMFTYPPDYEHDDYEYLNKKILFHVEKTYGDKVNRFMYFVTFGKNFGVKKIE